MKRMRDIREQLLALMDRTEIELVSNLGDHDAIKKAIAAGFFYNTARLRKDGAYRTIKNPQTIHIHPSSGLTKMEVSVSAHAALVQTLLLHDVLLFTRGLRPFSTLRPTTFISLQSSS